MNNLKMDLRQKEEMFEYLISCKYFTKETFINDNPNQIQRKKEKIRPIYKAFTEYITNKEYPENEHVKYCLDNKTEFQLQVVRDFNKEDIFNEENKKYQDQITIRNKFNGKIVSEVTQLEEKELGKFIKIFKGIYEDFDEYILINNKEKIKNDIAYFMIDLKYNTQIIVEKKLNKAVNNIYLKRKIINMPKDEPEFVKKCFTSFYDNYKDHILNTTQTKINKDIEDLYHDLMNNKRVLTSTKFNKDVVKKITNQDNESSEKFIFNFKKKYNNFDKYILTTSLKKK